MTQDGVHYSPTGAPIAHEFIGSRLAQTFI